MTARSVLCLSTMDTSPVETRVCVRGNGHPDRHRDIDGWTWGDPVTAWPQQVTSFALAEQEQAALAEKYGPGSAGPVAANETHNISPPTLARLDQLGRAFDDSEPTFQRIHVDEWIEATREDVPDGQ